MSKKLLECPKCGYFGEVTCTESLRSVGSSCECPKCGHMISQRRKP